MQYLEKVLISYKQPDLFKLQAALYAVCDAYVQSGEFYYENKENNLSIKIFEYVEKNFKENISLRTMLVALGYYYMSRAYHRIFCITIKNSSCDIHRRN